MTKEIGFWRRSATAAAFAVLLPAIADAHPHVWVSVETVVLYDKGQISGLRHTWTFDDNYTAMAIEGLDKNGDKTYSREELQELAQVNIDGLKEFGYFTYPKLGEAKVETKEPVDYWLEHKGGLLSLHFTLPLTAPLPTVSQGFNFRVYDETFFIAFDFAKETGVALGEGAPAGCSASVGIPEKDLAEFKALNDAFGGQMSVGTANSGQGTGYAPTAMIACKG